MNPYSINYRMALENKFIYYNSLRVAYSVGGEGKPLVMLHGWGSSSRVMKPLAKSLLHLRKVYLIELPGFGKSSEPPDAWGIDDYADMTVDFINTIQAEQVDFLVHSFGGRIILKLLARNDIKTSIGKVLITGGAGMKPNISWKVYFKKNLAKLLKMPFLILPDSLQIRGLERLRKTALWKKLGSSDYSKLSGVMRGTFVKSVNEHLDDLLPAIDHEILLLWGEHDDATPLYQARRMEDGLKNSALVVIKGAGHYAFLDKPKQFASIAEAFFK